jgi:hypothetical protein
LDTFCRIGCKTGTVFDFEAIHSLNQADGADGDQIFLIFGCGVVFSDDVGNKTEIVQNEFLAGILGTRAGKSEGIFFLSGIQRRRKILSGIDTEDDVEQFEYGGERDTEHRETSL